MSLSTIVGQLAARRALAAAQAHGRLHHAYLFEGPPGVGKSATARAVAAMRNCTRPQPRTIDGIAFLDACGACEVCRKIDEDVYPDLWFFDMTPKGLTERVRDLAASVAYRPHEGGTRVVVLDPADDLAGPQGRAEPANALLKTFEEPPAGTTFILVSAQPRRLPNTVRSRCQVLRFGPLDEATIAQRLVDVHGVDADAAALLASTADGSLGNAVARVIDDKAGAVEALTAERQRVEALFAAAQRRDVIQILTLAQAIGEERESAYQTIEAARRLAHRRIVTAVSGGNHERGCSLDLAIWQALSEALLMLEGNMSPALAVEHAALRVMPSESS